MTDKNKDSKLTRISLGGWALLLDFSEDNKQSWLYHRKVTFRGQKDGLNIKAIGFRNTGSVQFKAREEYDPQNRNSFLKAVNGILEDQNFYLGYVDMDTTLFRTHQKIRGALYTRKREKTSTET